MSEDSLFDAALAKRPEERLVFLEFECAHDPALLSRLKNRLAAHERTDEGVEQIFSATGTMTAAQGSQSTIAIGRLIAGRFKILECLGEGGMGRVYIAEQIQPVRRKVALKLIKAGMDSRRVLARFDAERQALALMDHPHIAKVLDAGLTEQGRPFFVMEYIKGVPLTEYCDTARLAVPQRLDLFVSICQAVQHAHQKGIIHRDLKPSNILVALYDGKPVPKVIDFGLAKAMHQPLTEQSLYTAHEMVLGTPLYMSPEQAELNNLDIDTRSDIYALGVILYELLTGVTPLERQRFKDAAWNEMLRMIKEEEPPKPSTRLSGSASLPSIAAQRQVEPVKLAKLMRGELDWIVMKALEKDRNRRYETANGFALDIQRYLAEEPVLAGPPTAAYRLRKLLRRNKGPVLAAGIILLVLVIGAGVSAWQAIRATKARQVADREREAAVIARKSESEQRGEVERQKHIVELERDRAVAAERQATSDQLKAKQSADDALAVQQFFEKKVLAAARPASQDGGLGVTATIRAAVDAAEPQVGFAFRDRPLVEASIRNTLGGTYWYLGESTLAIRQFEQSVRLRLDHLGPDELETLNSQNDLALTYQYAGKLDLAIPLFEQTLEKYQAKLGHDHTDTLTCMGNLASVYVEAGKLDRAISLNEKVVEAQKIKFGSSHPSTLTSMNNLAVAYRAIGQFDKALTVIDETLKIRTATLGPDHPDTLTTTSNLANVYWAAGQVDKAIPLYQESLEKMKVTLGTDHPKTLMSVNNLSTAYLLAGKLDQAIPLFEQTLEIQKVKIGPDHKETLNTMNNLAYAYQAAGTPERALPIYEQTVEKQKANLGSTHPDTLLCIHNLAVCLMGLDRFTDAEPLLRDVVSGVRSVPGFAHPNSQTFVHSLSDCYTKLNQPEKAQALWTEQASFWKGKAGPDSPLYAAPLAALGLNLLQQQKPGEAESVLRECLMIREKNEPDAWTTFNTKSQLGGSLLGQKDYVAAEPLLLAGYQGMHERESKIPPHGKIRIVEALERLTQLYDAWEKPQQSAEWRKKWEEAKPAKK